MSDHRFSASDLRGRAWNAMTETWTTVLAITFVISLATLIADLIIDMLPPLVGSILSLAVSIAVIVPQMGLVRGALDHLRRGAFTFEHISSMFPYAKQMICYSLWEALFAFLWMLPGLILTFIGSGILISAQDGTAPVALGGIIVCIGMCLTFVLVIRAFFNYTLGSCCIVDNPNMGGCAALEKSKQLMRGHRWLFFKMGLPVFLMIVLIAAITGVLMNKMDPNLLSIIISLLTIAPEVMAMYLAPVLYEEVNRIS